MAEMCVGSGGLKKKKATIKMEKPAGQRLERDLLVSRGWVQLLGVFSAEKLETLTDPSLPTHTP